MSARAEVFAIVGNALWCERKIGEDAFFEHGDLELGRGVVSRALKGAEEIAIAGRDGDGSSAGCGCGHGETPFTARGGICFG